MLSNRTDFQSIIWKRKVIEQPLAYIGLVAIDVAAISRLMRLIKNSILATYLWVFLCIALAWG